MREAHELPLRGGRGDASEGEAAEAPDLLHLAEDGLDGGLAEGVDGATSGLWPTALAQGVGLAVTVLEPAWFAGAIACANAVFVANIAIIWRPGKR